MDWTSLYFNTKDLNVFILGTGEVATRRANRFLDKGSCVKLVGNELNQELINKGATLYSVDDVYKLVRWADLVVIASGDEKLSDYVSEISKDKLVNRADFPLKGDVIVQSYNTDHYAIKTTEQNSYELFYNKEIESRKLASLPPFVHMSQIVVEDEDLKKAFEYGYKVKRRISEILPKAFVLGPATANIVKVNNKFRVQLTIKNKDHNYDLFKIIEENQDINIYIDHDPTLI